MLTGFIGRLAYAVLAGVVTALVIFVIGAVVTLLWAVGKAVGVKIEDASGIIGLLVAIVVFCAGKTWPTKPLV